MEATSNEEKEVLKFDDVPFQRLLSPLMVQASMLLQIVS